MVTFEWVAFGGLFAALFLVLLTGAIDVIAVPSLRSRRWLVAVVLWAFVTLRAGSLIWTYTL